MHQPAQAVSGKVRGGVGEGRQHASRTARDTGPYGGTGAARGGEGRARLRFPPVPPPALPPDVTAGRCPASPHVNPGGRRAPPDATPGRRRPAPHAAARDVTALPGGGQGGLARRPEGTPARGGFAQGPCRHRGQAAGSLARGAGRKAGPSRGAGCTLTRADGGRFRSGSGPAHPSGTSGRYARAARPPCSLGAVRSAESTSPGFGRGRSARRGGPPRGRGSPAGLRHRAGGAEGGEARVARDLRAGERGAGRGGAGRGGAGRGAESGGRPETLMYAHLAGVSVASAGQVSCACSAPRCFRRSAPRRREERPAIPSWAPGGPGPGPLAVGTRWGEGAGAEAGTCAG
ncbi:uncharacterized protein LOC141574727 [Camelus bactrianus]|uniref:Uncharacterized protein LOC141574727 n=1 Tax=Camelus bactrianus TaxID=9837 RepID=A0AC58PBY8_CAMBA